MGAYTSLNQRAGTDGCAMSYPPFKPFFLLFDAFT